MVRKPNGINMSALEIDDEANEKTFSQGASLTERGNTERGNVSKGGRPRVEEEDKANKPLTVYFTDAEREIVKAYCSRVSFSGLVKQLLAEKGIL